MIHRQATDETSKQHKHAGLIHAWADGAEIEIFIDNEWQSTYNPGFYNTEKYRIKPEKKLIKFRIYLTKNNEIGITINGLVELDPTFKRWVGDWQEVEVEE